MVYLRTTLVLICIIFISIFNGCGFSSDIRYQVITIEGAAWAGNISTSYISFGSTTESEEHTKTSILASNGDLLYFTDFGDLACYYLYSKDAGNHLKVTFDTLPSNATYINGKLAFLELTNDTVSWDFLKDLSLPVLEELSGLLIPDNLSEEQVSDLKSYGTSLHGVGLVIESPETEEGLNELLEILKPRWLVLNKAPALIRPDQPPLLPDLELLWLTSEDIPAPNLIQICPNLKSLILADWEPHPGEVISLTELECLHSLTLANCGIKDLSNFGLPSCLERLHILDCDACINIGGLKEISRLNSLSLSSCDTVSGLELINELPSLQWLSFPESITQAEFTSILGVQQSLEVIEINACSFVDDLSILQEQLNLKALILNLEETDLSQLSTLNHPELIVLNADLYEDSEERIAELREKLPDTEIVPGSGLCLGSGWLLLLLPLVVLVRFISKKTR